MKYLIFLLMAIPAVAQATTPCDSIGTQPGLCISWNAPSPVVGAAVASYSIYQQPLASGTMCLSFPISASNRIASSVVNTAYIQATVPTGKVCTEVTAVSTAGVEGPASTVATFPLPSPGQPTNLQVVVKP